MGSELWAVIAIAVVNSNLQISKWECPTSTEAQSVLEKAAVVHLLLGEIIGQRVAAIVTQDIAIGIAIGFFVPAIADMFVVDSP